MNNTVRFLFLDEFGYRRAIEVEKNSDTAMYITILQERQTTLNREINSLKEKLDNLHNKLAERERTHRRETDELKNQIKQLESGEVYVLTKLKRIKKRYQNDT